MIDKMTYKGIQYNKYNILNNLNILYSKINYHKYQDTFNHKKADWI